MSAKNDQQPDGANTAEKPACFILMPISDPDGYEKGHFKRVYEDIFKPACEKAGYKAVRADEVRQANLIHLDILQKLIESPMALCDLSSRNPNALFELGLRQAFDKPVVLVQEVGTPPIFDIAPLRYVEYRQQLQYHEVLEDQKSIADAIEATREDYATGKGVNSIVKLLSLTRSAALPNVTEEDKEEAFLELIMDELSDLRSEIRQLSQTKQSINPLQESLRLAAQSSAFTIAIPEEAFLKRLERLFVEVRQLYKDVVKAPEPTPEHQDRLSKIGLEITYLSGAAKEADFRSYRMLNVLKIDYNDLRGILKVKSLSKQPVMKDGDPAK